MNFCEALAEISAPAKGVKVKTIYKAIVSHLF